MSMAPATLASLCMAVATGGMVWLARARATMVCLAKARVTMVWLARASSAMVCLAGASTVMVWVAIATSAVVCMAVATSAVVWLARATGFMAMVCMAKTPSEPVYMARATADGPVFGYSLLGYAAYLDGRVYIRGPLSKPGGPFKIDHPLDPANKYLYHSFVESPDMKNIYDGVVALDEKGEAEIELPDWFGALNKDFRYQLTAIGAPGPNLYIAEEISDGVTNYSNN